MTYRGAMPFGSLYDVAPVGSLDEGNVIWGVMARSGSLQPLPYEVNVSGLTRVGGKFATLVGGDTFQIFDSHGGGIVWIYFAWEAFDQHATTRGDNAMIFTAGVAGTGSGIAGTTTDSLRIVRQQLISDLTKYELRIDRYTGTVWTPVGAVGSTQFSFGEGTLHYALWTIDIPSKTTELRVDGSVDISSRTTTNTPVIDTPTPWNQSVASGKGGAGADTMKIAELFMNDNSGGDFIYTYTDAAGSFHAVDLFPTGDTNEVWTPNSCGAPLRARSVRDQEITGDPDAADYITIAGTAGDQDQEFEMEDGDAAATLSGGGVSLFAGVDPDDILPSSLFLDDGTKEAKTGHVCGFSNSWRAAHWPNTPDGGNWAGVTLAAQWDSMTAGVRNAASSGQTQHCWNFFATAVGRGFTRRGGNALMPACTATFVPKVMMI